MENLIFRDIEDDEELNLFLAKVENYTGVKLPLDYAKRSKIVGAFLHEKLVAGYMLVTRPGFRSLMFVPDAIKVESPLLKKDQYEMMEVNGLWIGPALKTPKLQFRIWARLIQDIFACKKKFVLLMRNQKNLNMKKFLGMANPIDIYEGQPLQMAGERTHDSIQVSMTTRWKIVLNSHKYFLEFLDRQARATRFAYYKENRQPMSDSKAESYPA